MGFYKIWQKKLKTLSNIIITSLENPAIPLINYIFTFLFIILIRHFFEAYSQRFNYFDLPTQNLANDIIQFGLFYITVATILIWLFYDATKNPVNKIVRVVLPFFLFLMLAPQFDLIFSGGLGANMFYIQPNAPQVNIIYSYLTYTGGFPGMTPGIRTEVFIILIACYFYFRHYNVSIMSSIIYALAFYTSLFMLAISPYLVKGVIDLLGFSYHYSSMMMVYFYLITLFILGIIVFHRTNKKIFMVLLKDMRPLRVMHFELMLLLGVVIGFTKDTQMFWVQLMLNQGVVIDTLICMMAILFASFFAIIMNNISDIEIDKISNSNRPLIRGVIDETTYKNFAYFFLIAAVFYASMVSARAFLIISVTMGSYYLYSMLPLRIKRVPVLSKFVIGLNSLVLIILGYLIVHHSVSGFPNGLFLIFLVGYTLASNFIDLKDIKGDLAGGIKTLPILIGERKAQFLIGVASAMVYLSFYYLIRNEAFIPILIVGSALQFYLVFRKPYQEWPVLLYDNLNIVILMGILLLTH